MLNLSDKNFYFFYEDCSSLCINPDSIEHAYINLLEDNLLIAKNIFSSIDSPRAIWGGILISILSGYISIYPTFFQTRNFYEIDLDMLLKNNKIDYVEHLLGALEFLSSINNEVYKYTGRVMFINKFYSAALKYYDKSKKINYNDAELHFLLARYYIHTKEYDKSLNSLSECLKIVPEYFPALSLKKQIEETIF